MKMPNKHSAPRGRATLRMLDGGMPMNKVPMSAQDSTAFAGLQNTAVQQPAAPVAPAAPSAPAPTQGAVWSMQQSMQHGLAASLLNSFHPLPVPMKHGGQLRMEGSGTVPGTGQGDKIPAKYEPGEFVVSNDMLDAQPELRQHLSALREDVLAQKGMTPGQADAKALGLADEQAQTIPGDAEVDAPLAGVSPRGHGGGSGDAQHAGRPRLTLRASGGYYDDLGEPLNSSAAPRATVQAPGAGAVPRGSGFTVNPGGDPVAPTAAPSGMWGRTKAAFGGAADAVSSTAKDLAGEGSYVQSTNKALRNIGSQAMGPASVVAGLIPEQMKVKEVIDKKGLGFDAATQQAEGLGKWGAASAGALAAGTAALPSAPFTYGLGPVVASIGGGIAGYNAADGAIKAGRMLTGTTPTSPVDQTPTMPTAAPRDPNQTAATRLRTGLPLDTRVQANSDRDMRNHDFSGELNGAKGDLPQGLRDNVVYKTVDSQGRVTYSGRNVGVNSQGQTEMVDGMGRNSKMLDGGNKGYVQSVDANGKANGPAITSGMAGMGGDTNTATALHAAGLRGDTAALEGYYASKGQGFGGKTAEQITAAQEEANAPKRGESGYNHYQANKMALRQDATQRRGQDNQMEVAMAPIRYQQQQRALAGQLLQAAGGDLGAASKMAIARGIDPTHLQSAWTADTANRTSEQGMGQKANEQFTKDFGAFDPDGKPNAALAASKQTAIRKLFPGIDNLTTDARSKNMPEAEMLSKIYDRVATNPQMGWDKVNLLQQKGAAFDAMPDWKGGVLKRYGLDGALVPGAQAGGYYIEHKGQSIPLGKDLSQGEKALIHHHLQTGKWRGAPNKTE